MPNGAAEKKPDREEQSTAATEKAAPTVLCSHRVKYKEEEILFQFGSLERFTDLVQRQHDILASMIAGKKSLVCIEAALVGSLRMFTPLREVALAASLEEYPYISMTDGETEPFAKDFHENIEKLFSKINSLREEVKKFSQSYRGSVEWVNENMTSAFHF